MAKRLVIEEKLKCSKCKENKHVSLYWKNSKLYCGYNSWCIDCERLFRAKRKTLINKIENNVIENITYLDNNNIVCQEEWRDIPGYEGIYQVSNAGRIKSLDGFVVKSRGIATKKGKLLSIKFDKKGYCTFVLYKNKSCKTIRIHVLVAMAFLNHKPDGHKVVIDHKNNIQSDNRACNLQIVSQRLNSSKDKKGKTCQSTGVSFRSDKKTPYECKIRINRTSICLGTFTNEKEASEMYLKALNNISLFDGDVKKFKSFLNVSKRGIALTEQKVLAIRRLYRINPEFSRIGLSKKIGVHSVTITEIIKNKSWKHLL